MRYANKTVRLINHIFLNLNTFIKQYRNFSHGFKANKIVAISPPSNLKISISPSNGSFVVDASESVSSWEKATHVVVDFHIRIGPSIFWSIT